MIIIINIVVIIMNPNFNYNKIIYVTKETCKSIALNKILLSLPEIILANRLESGTSIPFGNKIYLFQQINVVC